MHSLHPTRPLGSLLSTRHLTVAALLIGVISLCSIPALSGSAFAQDGPWARVAEHASAITEEGARADFARAAAFLKAHAPQRDAQIDPDLVIENITYALKARRTFAWCAALPEVMFHNDVLPYAVLDETRERWRPAMFERAESIIKGARTAEEAAQLLNRELFTQLNVKYSTQRKKPNQSPSESISINMASCTGLSILLVDACRAVGIPARVAGVGQWPHQDGNHTWVEIFDGTAWRFTGAAEYDAAGLDRGWFAGAAAKAIEGDQRKGVWASSWAQERQVDGPPRYFPLAWNPADVSIPGVEVTARYRPKATATAPGTPEATSSNDPTPKLMLRVWDSRGGKRLATQVSLQGSSHTSTTFADPDDINRTADLPLAQPSQHKSTRITVTNNNITRYALLPDTNISSDRLQDLYWNELGVSKEESASLAHTAWNNYITTNRDRLIAMLDKGEVHANAGGVMRFEKRTFGTAPPNGHSLWISMHGGGGTTPDVNNKQWKNQADLYKPTEGIYIAPRAPGDTWDLWHRPEVDAYIDELILAGAAAWGIDPERVYLMGYSAGGDGVYQLAPRLADRFAAAAMMAGHPNNASPLNLRNLPFAILMGADDKAYDRNTVAQRWADELAALHTADPDGYVTFVRIYPGLGHWMQRKDAEVLPWMADKVRNPWPAKVVWEQGNVSHSRLYWLSTPTRAAQGGERQRITAEVQGQKITLTSTDVASVQLLLHDDLLNLDEPVTIIANTRTVFEGYVQRSATPLTPAAPTRPGVKGVPSAVLMVMLPQGVDGK